jgi:superfamily II DNA or RNA helicase
MGIDRHDARTSLALVVGEQTQENLRVYAASPTRVDEDAGQELNLAHGGYGKRQLLELVQNGADAMLSSPGGRIEVVLTEGHLYCANAGEPITSDGIKSLLHAHLSYKRGAEIGRFGLGFKSVLGVTDKPEFYSEQVSFGFDSDWSRQQIYRVAPGRERYPTLRLARLLDVAGARATDPILDELMSHATTVVRVPRSVGTSVWLSDDIKNFDPAFMLFSPHVGELILSDQTTGVHRKIELHWSGGEVILREGASDRRWRVFSSTLRPSQQAKSEAWNLSARDELPVVWAVPTDGRVSTGRFWAFFPLRDETTLTGIANAPWQVNDDRVGLLEGSRLNRELLDELCRLVLVSIPKVSKAEDPGWVLDVMPARGDEARCWGDDYFTRSFYDLSAQYPLIPDQDGRLQQAASLLLPPPEASATAQEAWGEAPYHPAYWCHAAALANPTRRSRVERIFEKSGRRASSVKEWMEELLHGKNPRSDNFAHAITTAALFITGDGPGREESRRLRIQECAILLDGGGHVRLARPSQIYIPMTSSQISRLRLVSQEVLAYEGVRDALRVIGVKVATPALELTAFLRSGLTSDSDAAWGDFWTLVREFRDPNEAFTIISGILNDRTPSVRTLDGKFRPLSRTLLPGSVVPGDGSRDRTVAIDSRFHELDLQIIRLLGGGQAPASGYSPNRDSVVERYRRLCVDAYIRARPRNSSVPNIELMIFEISDHVGSLEPLKFLSEEGCADFTEELIRATTDWRDWRLRHQTQEKYQPLDFDSAGVWAIKMDGRLRTTRGISKVSQVWGSSFSQWGGVAPIVEWLPDEAAAHLEVPRVVEELTPTHWRDALEGLTETTNDVIIGRFYAFAAGNGVRAPGSIRCRLGASHVMRPPTSVAVAHDRTRFDALRDLERPVLLVETVEDANLLVKEWSTVPARDLVRQETKWVENGAPVALVDAFPTLRVDLQETEFADCQLVPCDEIVDVIATERGSQEVPKDFAKSGNQFLWKADLGLEEAIRRMAEFLPFELSADEITDLASGRWEQERRDRLTAIRDAADPEERLLRAIGEDRLKSRLPVGLYSAVAGIHGKITPQEVARLMFAVHGDSTLKYLRDDLREAGLEPPDQWTGGRMTRTFVRDLGFPDEFAGAPGERRDPELIVPGPPDLPPLHYYQQQIVDQIHELLFGDDEHPRGLVSLPTGAGKTRVATQALVEALSRRNLDSPVLWVAPSDELCEQAVQTWSEVWRAFGSMEELRIGRLWASNEVPEAPSGGQVVIATPDKLHNKLNQPEYGWLAEASCVVIDEAHGATTPEYTAILNWLDISARGRSRRTRVPLLGLTATPFRGRSEEETKRLIVRFGARRLDRVFGDGDDYEETYRALQKMGVLSRVDGEELETGTTIDIARDLSALEKSSFEQMRRLPSRVLDTIAKDAYRNRVLLDSILSRPRDWPILLFAASTQHAHTMAALLTLEGISAAAVDSTTEPAVRRRYVDRFRRGELQVLANYGVLTQGFDAPATRAIYVARPTFSPNVYQQMIGRGLRGPLNGGKERCLIVNVRDNWITYGDSLAFYEFEHLWKPDEAQ